MCDIYIICFLHFTFRLIFLVLFVFRDRNIIHIYIWKRTSGRRAAELEEAFIKLLAIRKLIEVVLKIRPGFVQAVCIKQNSHRIAAAWTVKFIGSAVQTVIKNISRIMIRCPAEFV